jgi:alkanesulfonate monooxygenase SsuD/methylene tetrahydromethanopterin reductase-like flavin-dependent oxidoreductase (luciferase family)
MPEKRKLHLNAFLMSVGHHEASWRLPESDPYAGWSVKHYQELARIAERGRLDSLFLADSPVQQGDPGRRPTGKLEPTVLLTALAGVTSRIGLVATASTSYNEPYNLARRFSSLDHVSDGRAGWNIVPRSPQGWPLLVQAGSSEDGRDFAAKWAEAVFTAQQTLAEGRAFYRDLKQRAAALGRDPDGVKILPGIVPVIGDTAAEARELDAELERLISPEYARAQLAERFHLTPADLPLDEPLPGNLPTEDQIEGAKSRFTLIVDLARRENLTVRQLIGRLGGGRGHRTFAGTPVQVADTIEEWFDSGAADGFNIMPAVLPSGLVAFVDKVVPILQERGRFRTEYEGATLREHYGLPRPAATSFAYHPELITQ